MSWTESFLYFKDANATNQPVIAFTDGTNYAFAHNLLDSSGNVQDPSTYEAQAIGNTYLGQIATAVTSATPAGTNIIGHVTTDQTTHGTTDLVAADITKVAGSAIAQGHGTAATAIRVELPTDGNGQVGLASGTNIIGQVLMGAKVTTSSTITRPNNTTAYVAGQLIANSTSASTVNASIVSGTYTVAAARGNDIQGCITSVGLIKSGTSLSNAIYRVHLYSSQPTVSNGDGAAWLTAKAGYLGFFDITCTKVFTDGAIGYGVLGGGAGGIMSFLPVAGTANVFFLIEAAAAYTPVANETFSVVLGIN